VGRSFGRRIRLQRGIGVRASRRRSGQPAARCAGRSQSPPAAMSRPDLYHVYIQQSSIDAYIRHRRSPRTHRQPAPHAAFQRQRQPSHPEPAKWTVRHRPTQAGVALLNRRHPSSSFPTPTSADLPDQPFFPPPSRARASCRHQERQAHSGLSMAPGQDLGRFPAGRHHHRQRLRPLRFRSKPSTAPICSPETATECSPLGTRYSTLSFPTTSSSTASCATCWCSTTSEPTTQHGNPHLVTQPVIHVTGAPT
jgi:hypothetical protein